MKAKFVIKLEFFYQAVKSFNKNYPANKFIKPHSQYSKNSKSVTVPDKLLHILRILKSYGALEKNRAPVIRGLLMAPVCVECNAQAEPFMSNKSSKSVWEAISED